MTETRLATPADLSAYLGIPQRTIDQWRWLGKGPRWSKIGRHVRYRWEDVETWVTEQSSSGDSCGAARGITETATAEPETESPA